MLVANAWLCKINENKVNPVFCDFLVEDGKIKKIVEKDFNEYPNNLSQENDPDSFDVKGAVITIPNVNFHEHIYSRLAKGIPINGPMDNFLNILKNLWWKLDLALDQEIVEACTHMTAYESIRNGVQYIFDHHSSPNFTGGSLNCIKEILQHCNLKCVLCFETSDRNGKKLKEEALIENETFIKEQSNDNFKGMFGIHASFTVNDSTLSKVSEFLNNTDSGIHIHLCEDDVDNTLSGNKYGARPADRLNKYNLLNKKSIVAHAIHLSNEDFEILKNSDCAIAINLESNLNNAVGLPKISDFPDEVKLLIGTDGMHANVAKSFKQLFLILRQQGVSFDQAFRILDKIYFDQIKFVKQYFPDYTSLNINDRADFIVWDYIPPTPLTSDNFLSHYIYGIVERNVKASYCKDRFLMKNFNFNIPQDKNIERLINENGYKLYSLMKEK